MFIGVSGPDLFTAAMLRSMADSPIVFALAELAHEPVPQSVLDAYELDALEFDPEYIIPNPFDPRLIEILPPTIAEAVRRSGVARL